jgi:hypothetical protein
MFSFRLRITEHMFSYRNVQLIGEPQAVDECEREDYQHEKIGQIIGGAHWR